MAIPIPPAASTNADRVLRRLERERKEENEARQTVWAFVWTLFGFKLGTVAIIWYVAAGSGESLAVIAITTWYWLAIPIVGISGPLIYRWRMVRMRRRREELKRSEWREDPDIVVLPMADDYHLR